MQWVLNLLFDFEMKSLIFLYFQFRIYCNGLMALVFKWELFILLFEMGRVLIAIPHDCRATDVGSFNYVFRISDSHSAFNSDSNWDANERIRWLNESVQWQTIHKVNIISHKLIAMRPEKDPHPSVWITWDKKTTDRWTGHWSLILATLPFPNWI